MAATDDPQGDDNLIPDGIADPIETDYTVGQDNIQPSLGRVDFDIHNPVFVISGGVIVLFVVYALLLQDQASALFEWLRPAVTDGFDWFFLSAGNLFVIFCLLLIVTPLGSVRLGGSEARPDFGYPAWFAMLFAAGMGIGLMFYGVSEPLGHFQAALGGVATEHGTRTDWAPLSGAAGDTEAAMALGMAATIFHWGLHPWAIYAVVGLALAIFAYNKGLPLSIRSAFYPILGERIWGWPGHVIDILAVFATMFGLATSLGIGAEQALAGMNHLFGTGQGAVAQVVLITLITAIAIGSVLRGIHGGVRRLSEINILLAGLLMLFVLLTGPTLVLVGAFFSNLAAYVQNLPALSNPFGREDTNFVQGWTSFYWAWWISWSPFVGMFIARVSRGRTVREFVTCVLIVPTIVSVIWMTAFGQTAILQLVNDGYEAAAGAALEVQLFEMLAGLPLAAVTSLIGIILVLVFFITSSDSGSLVIDTITAGGKTDAPTPQRVFWCSFEGLVAIVLLLGGGLLALQAMVLTTGLPFAVVLLVMMYAIVVALRSERAALKGAAA